MPMGSFGMPPLVVRLAICSSPYVLPFAVYILKAAVSYSTKDNIYIPFATLLGPCICSLVWIDAAS